MSVKIRLRRTGRKKQPNYRVVVAESTTPRDGEYLDSVGTYNPLLNPAELRIDLEKVDKWLAEGAEMSDTVASLVRRARKGGDAKVTVSSVGAEEKAQQDVVGAAAPAAPAEPAAAAEPAEPAGE